MPPSEPRPIQRAGRPYTLLSTLRTRVGARGEHGVVLKHGADAGEVQLIHLQVAQGAGNMQRQYKGHTETAHKLQRKRQQAVAAVPFCRSTARAEQQPAQPRHLSGQGCQPCTSRRKAQQAAAAAQASSHLDGRAIGQAVGDGVRVAHGHAGEQPVLAVHVQPLLHHRLALFGGWREENSRAR